MSGCTLFAPLSLCANALVPVTARYLAAAS
jgi:hypothetical protein